MMKKILKIKGLVIIVTGMILISPVSAFAYKLLEPLPGLNKADVTLSDYLNWLFPFALTVTAVLAVIMIVIGGLQLAGGGSESLKTSGKKRIESAIYGLLLAVSAYLILYTINPNLVNMSLDIKSIELKKEKTGVETGVTTGINTVRATFDATSSVYNTREKCEVLGRSTHGERFIGAIFGGGKCTWVYKKINAN